MDEDNISWEEIDDNFSVDTVDTVDTEHRNTRSRGWMFTWNNFPEDYENIIEKLGAAKKIHQQEIGESGNHHIQGAIWWKNAKKFNKVKTLLPGAHIEPANNWNACVNYC